jgi:hypothetical protein
MKKIWFHLYKAQKGETIFFLLLFGGFFGETGVELRDHACKQALYCLSHTSSPFCSGYFGDGVLGTICAGWPWTMSCLISASQDARIQVWATSLVYITFSIIALIADSETLEQAKKWLIKITRVITSEEKEGWSKKGHTWISGVLVWFHFLAWLLVTCEFLLKLFRGGVAGNSSICCRWLEAGGRVKN